MKYSSKISVIVFFILLSTNIASFTASKMGIGFPIFDFLTQGGKFDDYLNSLFDNNNTLYETRNNFILFPLGTFIYKMLTIISFNNYLFSYSMVIILTLTIIAVFASKTKSGLFGFLIIITSYPYIFTISRGNNEFMLFPLVAYAWFLSPERVKIYFISFINALEPVPNHTAGLIKNIKDVLKFISIQIILLLPMLLLKNRSGENSYVKDFIDYNFRGYEGYAVNTAGLLHGHSLNGLFKSIISILSMTNDEACSLDFKACYPTISKLFEISGKVAFIAFLVALLFNFIVKFKFKLDTEKMFLFSSLSWLIFAPVSADYRLCYLPISLVLMLKDNKSIDENKIYIFLLTLVLIQKNFLNFAFESGITFTLGNIVNPLLLLLLYFKVIYDFNLESKIRKRIN